MSTTMDMDFPDWLLFEMSKRSWAQADLSRASGLDRQVISNYINRRRTNPEPAALAAIAHAFKISPITIFRKAGLLPPEGGDQTRFEDWEYLLEQLTTDEQEEIRQLVELKIDRRQKSAQAAKAKNFKTKKEG